MSVIEIKVPDIGDFKDVPIIEVLVKPGDAVTAEQSLITLESEKATVDVPTTAAGTIKEIKVKVGDKVSQGSVIALLESGAGEAEAEPKPIDAPAAEETKATPPAETAAPTTATTQKNAQVTSSAATPGDVAATVEVKVPDIGDFKDVPVIEVFVKVGDTVEAEQSVITLESEKATLDVPSPAAGKVKEVKLKVGDKVAEGSVILLLETTSPPSQPEQAKAPETKPAAPNASTSPPPDNSVTPGAALHMPTPAELAVELVGGHKPHASPSVRSFARELGVDVAIVKGSGPKGRITFDDIKRYVKGVMSGATSAPAPAASRGFDVIPWPKIDFSKFGPVEVQPLSRIKKLAGANLARNWVMIPHVTQFDLADITELEAHRMEVNKIAGPDGVKLTMLAFLIKACAEMLKKFPDFNASLDGENLVRKQYYHIGFAADTPQGLMVPVIRDADKKSVLEIALDTAALAKKARDGKIGAAEMQGGCFTISSLGGIGGTAFTPIINAPEVAILGVSRSEMQPRWNGREFLPRLMLPLSLSYDHRVIDGAAAARFTHHLAKLLADFHKAST